jgi:hypothetical protein
MIEFHSAVQGAALKRTERVDEVRGREGGPE